MLFNGFHKKHGLSFIPGIDMWEDWCFCVECFLKTSIVGKVLFISNDSCYHYIATKGSLSHGTVKLSTALSACEASTRMENALTQAGYNNNRFIQDALMETKLLAKDYLLLSGKEGIGYYYEMFPELLSFSWIWKLTRNKRKRYRWRHLLALMHLYWIYRLLL